MNSKTAASKCRRLFPLNSPSFNAHRLRILPLPLLVFCLLTSTVTVKCLRTSTNFGGKSDQQQVLLRPFASSASGYSPSGTHNNPYSDGGGGQQLERERLWYDENGGGASGTPTSHNNKVIEQHKLRTTEEEEVNDARSLPKSSSKPRTHVHHVLIGEGRSLSPNITVNGTSRETARGNHSERLLAVSSKGGGSSGKFWTDFLGAFSLLPE